MKRWISFFGHLAIIMIFASFGTYSLKNRVEVKVPEALKVESTYLVNVPSLEEIENRDVLTSPILLGNSFIGFKEALAFKESQGNYRVINC